ncbi:MAG: energy transducer TonB [Polaromonas sp.]|nr:energy transducer TonB [Polaromonas sp.]
MPSLLPSPSSTKPLLSRNVTIALSVVAVHVGLIWTLQSGLLIRAAEILIPVTVLSQLIDAPAPPQPAKPQPPAPPKPPAPTKPTPTPTAPVKPAAPPVPAQLQPLAVAAPAAQATVQAAPAPAPSVPVPTPAPAKSSTSPPTASTAAAVVQQPSSNADYLHNPKPNYPSLSARLGETGRTVYKVWIGVDGKPQRAELVSSSGFPRLDKAAYDTVMAWRYVPGMRNGVAETMAVNVPIHWELRS